MGFRAQGSGRFPIEGSLDGRGACALLAACSADPALDETAPDGAGDDDDGADSDALVTPDVPTLPDVMSVPGTDTGVAAFIDVDADGGSDLYPVHIGSGDGPVVCTAIGRGRRPHVPSIGSPTMPVSRPCSHSPRCALRRGDATS